MEYTKIKSHLGFSELHLSVFSMPIESLNSSEASLDTED